VGNVRLECTANFSALLVYGDCYINSKVLRVRDMLRDRVCYDFSALRYAIVLPVDTFLF